MLKKWRIIMRGKTLIKLLKAIDLLSKPEGATINKMAAHLKVDRRSVYRIIHVMEDIGFPIWADKIPLEKEKRWKFEESYLKKLPNMKIPDVNLTLPEVLSLYLLKGGEGLFKGTEIEKNINSAFGKLGLFLPEGALDKLSKIKALFISPAKFVKDYSEKEDIIDNLTTVMLNNETCKIEYHSFYDDKIKYFKIDPLHFFENDGGLYILVNTTTFGDIRTLAVERIQEITKTGEFFDYPKNFYPEELIESAFDIVYGDPVDVKIWFSSDQARYIKERNWSKTQKIEDQEDGSIILSMNTSGWWDIKRWVLSYGAEAKVLEPKELRNYIRDELKASIDSYR